MNRNAKLNHWTLAALLAAGVAVALAPAASADPWFRGHGERFRRHGEHARVVFIERDRHGVGPAFAGLVGGMILGAAIAHEHPVFIERHECAPPPPPPAFRYEDAWSDRVWDSLESCREAARYEHGPRVIRVIDNETGRYVRTLVWKHDHFIDDEGDD